MKLISPHHFAVPGKQASQSDAAALRASRNHSADVMKYITTATCGEKMIVVETVASRLTRLHDELQRGNCK